MELDVGAQSKTEEEAAVLPPPQPAPAAASPAVAAGPTAPAAPVASPAVASESAALAAPAAAPATAATVAVDRKNAVLEPFEYNFRLSQNLAPDSVSSMHHDLLLSDTPADPRFAHHGPAIVWLHDGETADARNENQSLADSMKPLPLLPFVTFGMMPNSDSLLLASVFASEAVVPSDSSDELMAIRSEWALLTRSAYNGPQVKVDADQELALRTRFRKL